MRLLYGEKYVVSIVFSFVFVFAGESKAEDLLKESVTKKGIILIVQRSFSFFGLF